MKNHLKYTLVLTLLWLLSLFYISFFTDASSTTITMVYVIGQGFLTAWVISQWNNKSCRNSKKSSKADR